MKRASIALGVTYGAFAAIGIGLTARAYLTIPEPPPAQVGTALSVVRIPSEDSVPVGWCVAIERIGPDALACYREIP